MKNVTSINFGFENCDHAEIPVELVQSFYLGDITNSLNFYPYGQGTREYKVAGKLSLHFKEHLEDFKGKTQSDNFINYRLVKCNDICWFGVKYDDNTEDIYQVKWVGDDQYENEGQRYEFLDNGDLLISINIKE